MSSNVPYTFRGGEAAKAQEVNANFQQSVNNVNNLQMSINNIQASLDEGLINKANVNGDSNQPFEVAPATKPTDAVQYNQFLQFQEIFKMNISGFNCRIGGPLNIIVSAGGCYDSTYNYPIVSKTNLSEFIDTMDSNSTYFVAAVATIENPYGVSIVVYKNSISLMDNQVYRDIARFTSTAEGQLPNEFERV